MDLQKLIEYRNAHNPFSRLLGIRLTELEPGRAAAEKTVTESDLNPLDYPHGGVYFTMADTACGTAMAAHGYAAVTLNASFQFLRAAEVGDRLRAEALEVKHGRTISVYEARVTDQRGRLLAAGTFTFCQLDRKLEI